MKTPYERFSELMEKHSMKPVDVCRESGVSSTVLTEWKKGKAMPKADKMVPIAKAVHSSVEYIVTGEISEPDLPEWAKHPEKLGNAKNVTQDYDATRTRSAEEMELLRGFRAATPEARDFMLYAARKTLGTQDTEKKDACGSSTSGTGYADTEAIGA